MGASSKAECMAAGSLSKPPSIFRQPFLRLHPAGSACSCTALVASWSNLLPPKILQNRLLREEWTTRHQQYTTLQLSESVFVLLALVACARHFVSEWRPKWEGILDNPHLPQPHALHSASSHSRLASEPPSTRLPLPLARRTASDPMGLGQEADVKSACTCRAGGSDQAIAACTSLECTRIDARRVRRATGSVQRTINPSGDDQGAWAVEPL